MLGNTSKNPIRGICNAAQRIAYQIRFLIRYLPINEGIKRAGASRDPGPIAHCSSFTYPAVACCMVWSQVTVAVAGAFSVPTLRELPEKSMWSAVGLNCTAPG
jgi:hypothetical protein